MSAKPGLQTLAIFARDHFGEDGWPFNDGTRTSFDVVLEEYARQARGGTDRKTRALARKSLIESLTEMKGASGSLERDADRFVGDVMRFLDGQYAKPADVQGDRLLLSHLFWGNLVEARWAARAMG